MSRRRKAREIAVQILFKDDFNPKISEFDRRFIAGRLEGYPQLIELTTDWIEGVRRRRDEIDAILQALLTHWKLGRLSAAERNILRLGTYEILEGSVPGPVVVNEAIELAKRYGHDQSHQFVNGVLDKVLKQQSGGIQLTTSTEIEDAKPRKTDHCGDDEVAASKGAPVAEVQKATTENQAEIPARPKVPEPNTEES